MKILPYSGLFLTSGITTVIQDYLINDPTFMNNFLEKGRMKEVLKKIPIFFAGDDVGLKGWE